MPTARKSVALAFAAHFIESKVGKTGLTVTVDVWRHEPDGTATEIVTGASATEMGDGFYRYELSAANNNVDRANYYATFKTATDTVDQRDLAGAWTVDHTILLPVNNAPATVVSSVDGSTLTAYLGRSWVFTSVSAGTSVDSYETVVFSVKKDPRNDADTAAILRVHSDNGLERIGGAAPADSANGTVTFSGSAFTVQVEDAETDATSVLLPGRYTWALIGIDTTPTPDTSTTIVTGAFVLRDDTYTG